MTFPAYPDYKDSGVEWLGIIPTHWKVLSISRIASEKCDGPFGSGIKSEHYLDEGVRVVRLQNIRDGWFDGKDAAFIDSVYYQENLRRHDVLPGDVLIAGLGDERNLVGRSCVAPAEIGKAIVKADCFRFRLHTNIALPIFVSAQLNISSSHVSGAFSSGSTRGRINLSTMSSRLLTLPPLAEQQAIAAFLDRETTKIDALIAEQEKMIALLTEKRQAVISHAVTKGLDPTAPMKDSGVEWLGEVPSHWEVIRLKTLLRSIDQGWSPEAVDRLSEPGEWGVLKSGCVNGGIFRDTEHKTLPDGIEPPEGIEVRQGDVLMSRASGSIDLIGSVAVVEECSYRLIMSDKIFRLNVDRSEILPELLVLQMASRHVRSQIRLEISGAEGLANNIGKSSIRELWLAMPPLPEQKRIIDFSQDLGRRLGDLSREAHRAIDLLKERRAALISAAVTGKIDVRGLVEAADAPEAV